MNNFQKEEYMKDGDTDLLQTERNTQISKTSVATCFLFFFSLLIFSFTWPFSFPDLFEYFSKKETYNHKIWAAYLV